MNTIQFIKTQLNEISDKIPVEWDRYTCSDNIVYNVYGWVKRSDGNRDFVLIQFFFTGNAPMMAFVTSSAKYSKQIGEVICGEEFEHTDCIKISELK